VLRDRKLDRRFRRDGYAIVPTATPEQLAAALEVFEQHRSGIETGYYASIHSMSTEYKIAVDAALTELLWPGLDEQLHDHRSLVAAFMVKEPSGPSVVPVHQDWNTMVEGENAGITCWIPLTPVTEAEGRFRLLPGSHRHLQRLRGSPGFPAPWEHISDDIDRELMIDVDVPVGHALIMDGRVLHTTPQNRSNRRRVAAYINALPNEVPSVHYWRGPEGQVEGHLVPREFFTRFRIGEHPGGEVFLRLDPYDEELLSVEGLRRAGRRRWPFGR
jgi:hypothetical protein